MLAMEDTVCVIFILLISGCWAACPSNCNYNGRCDVKTSKCLCYQGFYGSDCKGDCGCNSHGTCLSDNTCKCDDGWKYSGGHCVWDCHCLNGAKCMSPGECGCDHLCKHGECRNGQCQCWEGYKGQDCSQYDPTIMTNHGIKVGMNLGGITYYSSEVKFVDIAKESMEWFTQRDDKTGTWDTKEHNIIHWLPDGYPASLPVGLRVCKLIYRNFGAHEEQGIYTILWDGDGEVGFKLTQYKILFNGKGRMVVQFNHIKAGGILITVGNVNPKKPLRNLRFIAPGYENINDRFPFHPVFLENLKRYSEFRYMDFSSTNNHKPEPTTWKSRHDDKFHTQAGKEGGALEYMIKLSNKMGASPWFCMPHAADDNYVEEFAKMVKAKLRPDLKIYIEYSNEVWNGIFRQTQYTREKGLALKLSPQGYRAGLMYYNIRSAQIMDIWNKVFGSEASKRVSGVWTWQTGYQDYYRQALEDLGTNLHKFKNIAITGYFDCLSVADKHAAELPTMTMAQIQKYCKDELPKQEASFKHYLSLAKAHGVQLVMYEGGPGVMESSAIAHFGQANKATTDKAIAFNKDIHMEQSVMDNLNLWNKIVTNDPSNSQGGLFNYFTYTGTPSKYGSWGMLEYTGQDPKTVAKFRGVQKFLTSTYSNVPRGPKCTFIKNGAVAYGCYSIGNIFECGLTDNNGRTWSKFNVPSTTISDTLVLDGYNRKKDLLYIRVTDTMGVNSYHVYNTKSHQWTTQNVNFQYYTDVASHDILPTMSAGVYDGLNGHGKC